MLVGVGDEDQNTGGAIGVVIVVPTGVINFFAFAHQADELLDELGVVEEFDIAAVEQGFKARIQL